MASNKLPRAMANNRPKPSLTERSIRKGISRSKSSKTDDASDSALTEEDIAFNGYLTPTLLHQLLQIPTSSDDFTQRLADILLVAEYQTSSRDTILLDLYYTEEKIMQFYSILRDIHSKASNNAPLEEACEEFRSNILRVSLPQPGKTPLFSSVETKLLIDYFTSTYLQSYLLYQFVFNEKQEELADDRVVYIHTAMPPPPLSQGISINTWNEMQSQMQADREAHERELLNQSMEGAKSPSFDLPSSWNLHERAETKKRASRPYKTSSKRQT
ncbi:coiled-coil domain-containing protein [Planoprotostelium fungivorum]|uniref:Coiled-coil domain-containing protein n=1 Tax=Planoprotostelium fungivorum TaxID=1890364 RepID=A0A2P6MW88_9EUKA|nr:coiled-coil domain-containing protein [Planoprotostelium fungivorum]